MRTLVTCIALLGLVGMAATPAQADRRLTREEKSSIRSAMKDAQCSGGKMEFDDGKFEVDNAKCQNGKRYDLTFDQNFKLTSKEFEDRAGRSGYYGSGRYDRRELVARQQAWRGSLLRSGPPRGWPPLADSGKRRPATQ